MLRDRVNGAAGRRRTTIVAVACLSGLLAAPAVAAPGFDRGSDSVNHDGAIEVDFTAEEQVVRAAGTRTDPSTTSTPMPAT